MELLDELLAQSYEKPNISGEWFLIQWSPDIATEEKLNIGVGLVEDSGEFSVQMLDYYERISCLYSKDMIFHLSLACEVSRQFILSKKICNGIVTPQISCFTGGYAQGKSAEEILSILYKDKVPLGKKSRTLRQKSYVSTSRDSLYNSVCSKLKSKFSLDYSIFVPENPYQSIIEDNKTRQVYLPFRKTDGVATLVSAAYADPQRVKCNIYDGFRDIDIASTSLNLKNKAIFMLLPDETLATDSKNEIENEIDKFSWFMKKKRIYVESNVSTENLADDISNWCVHRVA